MLVLATGHNPAPLKPLDVFRRQSTVAEHTQRFGFQVVSQKNSTATALVAHFELTDRSQAASGWLQTFTSFDWTVDNARGANTRPIEFQEIYGLVLRTSYFVLLATRYVLLTPFFVLLKVRYSLSTTHNSRPTTH